MADGSVLAQQGLLIPSGTSAQRPASPTVGYMRYNTDIGAFEGWNGTVWGSLGGGAKGGASDLVFYENDVTITTNYTITTNKNAMTAGPVTINDNITVTIPDGSTWTIV